MTIQEFNKQVKSFGKRVLGVKPGVMIKDFFFDPDTGCNSKKVMAELVRVHIKCNGHVFLLDRWGNEFEVKVQEPETLDAIIANIIIL